MHRKMKRIAVSHLKSLIAVTLVSLIALSCEKDITNEIIQTFENGTLIESVNGKKLTCRMESSSIESGHEIVLICNNETNYNASIDVEVNGETVGTISKFPAEFRHTINEPGIHQFSISGTLKPKGGIFSAKPTMYFSYEWKITVE